MTKARINIYVDDLEFRKQVRREAANQDVSISEFCLSAIRSKLGGEEDGSSVSLSKAIEKARRFQAHAFPGRIFSVRSADLIRQSRTQRDKRR